MSDTLTVQESQNDPLFPVSQGKYRLGSDVERTRSAIAEKERYLADYEALLEKDGDLVLVANTYDVHELNILVISDTEFKPIFFSDRLKKKFLTSIVKTLKKEITKLKAKEAKLIT